jgi:hypothetical protein
MADKYIIMLQVMETKRVSDLDVPSKVTVQLQLTDPDLNPATGLLKRAKRAVSLRR